jgi:hypothetical protein
MSRLVKKWIPVAIAVGVGWIMLGCYLFPNQLMTNYQGRRVELRVILVEWAVIVAAFAFLLGLFNILRVHSKQILRRRPGWHYSMVLLVFMLLGVIPTVLSFLPVDPSIQETSERVVFDYIISPLGASLAALLVFTLALAAFRLIRTQLSPATVWFLVVVTVVLLGSVPLVGLEWLVPIRDWIVNVPGMAGMRGLLLGVALGTAITAIRVLFAIDQPYGKS